MPVCKKIRSVHRKVCAGDLDRVVTIQDRAIQPPTDSVDYTLLFTDGVATPDGQIFASIKTVTGEEVFDGHNVGTPVTHHIIIPFIEGVTAETWVKLEDGTRLNIVQGGVEDLDERNEFLLLRCTTTGSETQSNNAT